MSERHPSSEAFHAVLRDAGEMHDRKQRDYGTDEDPFANVRAASEWGMPGSLGACIRMGDKLRRLQAFYRKGTLANESVEDAFMDLLVYAGIGLLLYREESDAASAASAPAPLARVGRCAVGGSERYRCTKTRGHDGPHRFETPPANATCVLCHSFIANHGPTGECPQ